MGGSSTATTRKESGEWAKVPEILKNIVPPTFPDSIYDVTAYGAKSDTSFDSRPAILEAINQCNTNGGGTVLIPAGNYFSKGAILLMMIRSVQMAKALGKYTEYGTFNDRGYWWKNAVNPENGYAHMRDSAGNFVADFDAFQTGRNHHYVEGNSWQLSYFVPQDVPALINIMGEKAFVDRLNWGFVVSEPRTDMSE